MAAFGLALIESRYLRWAAPHSLGGTRVGLALMVFIFWRRRLSNSVRNTTHAQIQRRIGRIWLAWTDGRMAA